MCVANGQQRPSGQKKESRSLGVNRDCPKRCARRSDQTHTGRYSESIEAAARSLAINLIRVAFREAGDIERGIEEFARQPNGRLLVLSDPSTGLHREQIVTLAARHGLPGIYPFRFFITIGGLASYGVDRRDQFRRAAVYVARVFKGESPADLMQAPIKFELVINAQTARMLGLTVPPSLLASADGNDRIGKSVAAVHESGNGTSAICGDCEFRSAYEARAVARPMPPKGRV